MTTNQTTTTTETPNREPVDIQEAIDTLADYCMFLRHRIEQLERRVADLERGYSVNSDELPWDDFGTDCE